MSLKVVVADAEHIDWLTASDAHVSPDWVARCVKGDEYLVGTASGEPVGLLRFCWFWRAIPYMERIHVVPACRRAGVGTAMFTFWETAMRARGATLLMTSAMSNEPEPQAWHRRNGFVESGALSFGRLEPTPELFFVKDL